MTSPGGLARAGWRWGRGSAHWRRFTAWPGVAVLLLSAIGCVSPQAPASISVSLPAMSQDAESSCRWAATFIAAAADLDRAVIMYDSGGTAQAKTLAADTFTTVSAAASRPSVPTSAAYWLPFTLAWGSVSLNEMELAAAIDPAITFAQAGSDIHTSRARLSASISAARQVSAALATKGELVCSGQ